MLLQVEVKNSTICSAPVVSRIQIAMSTAKK
jgi:hypothetical protein